MAASQASQVSMWLPRGFADRVQAVPWGSKFCFFDATQRGDMYHIRAWQVLGKGNADEAGAGGSTWHPPTIICNYVPKGESKSNEATVDYITEIIPKETWTFITRWSWEELTNPELPDTRHRPTKYDSDYPCDTSTMVRSSMNKKLSFGPSECTDGIKESGNRDRSPTVRLPPNRKKQFNIIIENMVKVDVNSNKALKSRLDHSYESVFPPKKAGGRKRAVILWRDTAVAGGPYPELNTGEESAKQLIDILDSLGLDACFIDVAKTAMSPKVLEKAHCAKTPYFKDTVLESNLWPPESSGRDREAFWVKRAYKEGWFNLVVGLRSGALDSMTFLGIPTVSIGLQDMIGETRMHKLGGDLFKRVNVDYAIPRHPGTGLVKPKRDGDLVFQSPAERPGALRGFTPFDERTVRIGIIFAAAQYLNDTELKKLKKPSLQNERLVTSQDNRAYWDGVETDPPQPWNKSVKDMEDDDYRQPTDGTEESQKRYAAEKRKMEASWTKLREKADKKASDKAGKAGKPRTVDRGMRSIPEPETSTVDRGMRSIPEPETRSTPVPSRAQRKAEKAARKKNAPKGHRNCVSAGVWWLCCGIFRRR